MKVHLRDGQNSPVNSSECTSISNTATHGWSNDQINRRSAVNASSDADGRNECQSAWCRGVVVAAGTANSPSDFANSMADTGSSIGVGAATTAAGGTIFGGLLMLLRGASQSLGRGSELLSYLLGIQGYAHTLALLCVKAAAEAQMHTTMPPREVPASMLRSGEYYSHHRITKYLQGFDRVGRIITEFDNLRPSDRNAWFDSKTCLVHIATQTSFTGTQGENRSAFVIACKAIITEQILQVDLRRAREQLRRWSNEA